MAIQFQSPVNQIIAEGIQNANGAVDSIATLSGGSMPEAIRNKIANLIGDNLDVGGGVPSEIITQVANLMLPFTPTMDITSLSKVLLSNSVFGSLGVGDFDVASIINDQLNTFINQYERNLLEITGGFSAVLGSFGISDGLAAITDKLSGGVNAFISASLSGVLSSSELSLVSTDVVGTFLVGDGIINLLDDLPDLLSLDLDSLPEIMSAIDEDFNIDLGELSNGQRDTFAAAYVQTASGTDVPIRSLKNTMGQTRGTVAGTSEQTEPLPAPNPFPIDADTIAPLGSFISSVEELEAEMASITRPVSEVIVHWSETYTNANLSAAQLTELTGAGDVTYHFIIRRDGSLERGAPLNSFPDHCAKNNHNEFSLAVCFVGGLNVASGSTDVFEVASSRSLTLAQYNTFYQIMRVFFIQYPGGQALGHMDIDTDHEDPGFDVRDYVLTNFNKQSLYSSPFFEPALSPADILDIEGEARGQSGLIIPYTSRYR